MRRSVACSRVATGIVIVRPERLPLRHGCGRSRRASGRRARELVNRPLYRGEIVYGATKKRNVESKVDPSKRPASEWLRIPAPSLRILSPELSEAVAARIAAMHTRSLHASNGTLLGRPPGRDDA
jgi:hypothetical protein